MKLIDSKHYVGPCVILMETTGLALNETLNWAGFKPLTPNSASFCDSLRLKSDTSIQSKQIRLQTIWLKKRQSNMRKHYELMTLNKLRITGIAVIVKILNVIC